MKLKQTWIFDTDIVKRTLMLVIWNASMIPFFLFQQAICELPKPLFQSDALIVWVSYSHANITHSDFHNKGFYA